MGFSTLIFHNVPSDILLLVIAYLFELMRIRYGKYCCMIYFVPFSIFLSISSFDLSTKESFYHQTYTQGSVVGPKEWKKEKRVDPKRIGLFDIDINKIFIILFAIWIINRVRLFKILYYSSVFRSVFDYQLQGWKCT